MQLPRQVTLELHQILRLPRKVTLKLHHVLRLPRNKWSSSSHMRATSIPLQHHQILRLPHKIPFPNYMFANSWNVILNAETIREWSENDPTMKSSVRNAPRNRGYFSSSPRALSMEKYKVSRPILHSKLHQVLRLPRKVTLELHQVLHLPRKVILELHQILRLPRKVTSDTCTARSTAPATRNDPLPLLYCSQLYGTLLLYSTLLNSILLYCSWTTVLYSTLLNSIVQYCN